MNTETLDVKDVLNKLIMGDKVYEFLSANLTMLLDIVPELEQTVGFEQNNPYHCYDVMTHTLKSIDVAPKDLLVRLALLFHDIAKPLCYTESDDGAGHFYRHPQKGSDMAKEILTRLGYDDNTLDAVTRLIMYHDSEIRRKQHIRRWLNKIGEERFRQLLEVKRADTMTHAEHARMDRLNTLYHLAIALDEIILEQPCFSLKDLAVNGRDLIAAGIPQGTQIGVILNRLMDMVIDEETENDKAVLLDIAKKIRTGE